jgi:hypothetical protein
MVTKANIKIILYNCQFILILVIMLPIIFLLSVQLFKGDVYVYNELSHVCELNLYVQAREA